MGIKRQYGKVSSIAKLAKLAGEAKQESRNQELRMQMEMQAQEAARRERLARMKMQMDEQMDYRAMEWEGQKIQARSQHDFMMQEARHQALQERETNQMIQKLNQRDQLLQNLTVDDSISDKDKGWMAKEIEAKTMGINMSFKPQSEMDRVMNINKLLGDYQSADPGKGWFNLAKSAKVGDVPATPQEEAYYEGLKQSMMGGVAPAASGPKPLDAQTAAALLKEVGGDKDKARQLARSRGYSF